MTSGISTYGRATFLGQMFGLLPVPPRYWIALCTDQPGEGMDGDILADLEPPAGTGYGRVAIPTGPADWTIAGGYLTNLTALDFGVPLADWGRLDHWAILEAETAGNLCAFGEILNPELARATFDVLLPPGSLMIALYELENSITP